MLFSGVALGAPGVSLRPHEATYSMTQLRNYARPSPVEGAQGLLHYTFRRTCDGWTVEHQTALNMLYENALPVLMNWRYTAWESTDGKRLRFRSSTMRNQDLIEKYQGEARQEGSKTVALYQDPNGRREEMPQNLLFPTRHLEVAFEHARRGENVFSAPYFDGSGAEGEWILDTVITAFKGKPLRQVEDTVLAPLPVWNVQLGFYQPGPQNTIAEMEITARYREDGVATRLVQDFGDFILVGQLVELTYLEEPVCQ